MAAALALAFLAPACGIIGLSAEEQEQLANFQQRARYYYDGNNLNQALQQVERGLEIEPDDYSLRWLRAMVFLRSGPQTPAGLDKAERYFEELFAERDLEDHHPNFLLGYAWVSQRLALREQRRALEIEQAIASKTFDATETEVQDGIQQEHENKARSLLFRARGVLDHIVAEGEEVMQAENTLMQVHATLQHYDEAIAHGDKFLAANRKAIKRHQEVIRDPQTDAAAERLQWQEVKRLRDLAFESEQYLAALEYKRGEFQKAVERLDAILDGHPHIAEHYYNRAEALMQLGQQERAREDFMTFLVKTDLAPGNEKVRRARSYVDQGF